MVMVCVAPTAGGGAGACGRRWCMRRAADGKIGSGAKAGEAQTNIMR